MNIATFKKVLPALRLITPHGAKKPNERTIDIGTSDIGTPNAALVIKAADVNTDLEIRVVDVETSTFDGCVNFAKFNTLIGALKSMPSFDYATGTKHSNGAKDLDALVIQSGKRTIRLDSANLSRMDYGHRLFKAAKSEGLQWNVSRLTEGLEYISTAISNDETRFHLNGILLAENGDMVSTDGHRLHLYSYHYLDDGPAEFFGADKASTIVPKQHVKMIESAIKACGGDKAEVYSRRGVQSAGRYMQFVVDGNGLSFKITFKLIDSQFPPYQAVIPKGNTARATVNVLEFTAATKLLDKMMKDSYHKTVEIRLNGQLHLKGGGVTESLEAPYEGEGFDYGELGANSKYLAEAADLPSECFTLEFGKALEPIKFSHGAFLGVVMPHRV